MNKRNRNKKRLLITAALSLTACFLCACAGNHFQPEDIDEAMIAWVNAEATRDAGEIIEGIRSIDSSRKESSREESRRESSVEASVRASELLASIEASAEEASSILESLSIAESESVEQSIAESNEALLASIQESIYSGGEPTGVLTPGKIVTVGDEAIPEIRRLFKSTVVLGNSRARSVLDSGILTDETVLYKWAAHMDEITEIVLQGANLHRDKVLFIMGVNDLGYYTSNVAGWKAKYIEMIELFRSINPNTEIYLQEIIPINENYRFRWYNMDRVVDYNRAIGEICEEQNCTMVTATMFAFPEFLNDETGAHYNKQFHFYWAQAMANQMNLWEDLDE